MVIAALCETHNRYHFFRRIRPILDERGGRLIILSNRLSIVLAALRDGFIAKLIKEEVTSGLGELPKLDDYEVDAGIIDLNYFEAGLEVIKSFFDKFLKLTHVDAFFFWNGSSFVARAMGACVRQHGIKSLYFEIGNFPGKLFVDPEGVNIRSRFASSYLDMDRSAVDMGRFASWVDDFLESKNRVHHVPQAHISTAFNWSYPIDMAGFYLCSAPWSEKPRVIKRTFNYLMSRLIRYDFDEFYPRERPFFFFPLQVSTDSQILWNSPVSILDAIEMAAEMAAESGSLLVVKPHPAEIDRMFVKRLAQLRDKFRFLFVDNNTFELIRLSKKVITINSTVGLEAMLCGMPVTCLGNPMYEHFTRADLAFYIQCYLLDVDFFDNEPLNANQFNAILRRL